MILSGNGLAAQDAPIRHVFYAQTSANYRVRLVVGSKLEGQRTEKIGETTYAVAFRHAAESNVEWNVHRSVTAVDANGEATIEESLDGFRFVEQTNEDAEPQSVELKKALRETLESWARPRTVRYVENPSGQMRDPGAEGAPLLGETDFPALALWLRRALRPTVTLPERALRLGDRWEEPRSLAMGSWTEVAALESGEWLEAQRNPDSAVRLHIVQQISARTPGVIKVAPPPGEPRENGGAQFNFHAESLNTVSLQDGLLLAATRSGSREVTQVLGPVTGLPEPPQFRATLFAQVEIEQCDETLCAALGSAGP